MLRELTLEGALDADDIRTVLAARVSRQQIERRERPLRVKQ
jgi:hypothetical protein